MAELTSVKLHINSSKIPIEVFCSIPWRSDCFVGLIPRVSPPPPPPLGENMDRCIMNDKNTINENHGNDTVAYQEHKACGYGYKIVCPYDDKYSKPTKIYRGPDAVYKLIEN